MKVNIGPYKSEYEEPCGREIDIQIEKFDTWNMDHTLAMIIVPMLKQLKETTHGYPSNFSSHDEWNAVLDEMIWAFEAIVRDEYILADDYKATMDRIQRGTELFGKYYTNLWD